MRYKIGAMPQNLKSRYLYHKSRKYVVVSPESTYYFLTSSFMKFTSPPFATPCPPKRADENTKNIMTEQLDKTKITDVFHERY